MSGRPDYVLSLSPAELQRYRYMAELARKEERPDWAAAGIVSGARVGDIGCGPGAVAVVLAEVVGPTGSVDAVDRDPRALEMASALVKQAGLNNVRLSTGEADDTGLPQGAYDSIVLRHVLAHNGSSEQAIVSHLATLVRPGGSVYLLDIDAAGARIVPEDQDVADLNSRYVAFHRSRGNDLSVGIRLGSLLRAAGLVDIHHRGWYSIVEIPSGDRPPSWAAVSAMAAAGVVPAADVRRFDEALSAFDSREERPTLFQPLFSALGRRPPGDDA